MLGLVQNLRAQGRCGLKVWVLAQGSQATTPLVGGHCCGPGD